MTEAEIINTKIDLLSARRALFIRELNFKIAILEERLKKRGINTALEQRNPQKHRATNFGYKDEAIDSKIF